jgi:polar amino acid transport system substrate-binding protein
MLISAVQPRSEPRVITLVTVENTLDTIAGEVILSEAYSRLGIKLITKRYPGERALRMANSGEVDGELQRIDAMSEQYTNLVQIRPAVNFLEASAFSKLDSVNVDGWESLRTYRIGIIRGIKFSESPTIGFDRHFVGSYESLFTMLDKGRVQVAVTQRINGLAQLYSAQLNDIAEINPPIERFELYHYLHIKNHELVPLITAVLEKMKSTGEIDEIREYVNSMILERAAENLPLIEANRPCTETYAWIPEDTD